MSEKNSKKTENDAIAKPNSESEIERSLIESQNLLEKTKIAAEFLLKIDHKSKTAAISGPRLWDRISTKFGNIKDASDEMIFRADQRNTFLQYLSRLVANEESPINSEGQRKGFYYDSNKTTDLQVSTEKAGPSVEETSSDTASSRSLREKYLYPTVQAWLASNQYQAADVSSGRSMGKWGNPDVAGINVVEGIDSIYIEIATVEVKTSSKGWEQLIFEAVSHRRFANRVYFAFATKEQLRAVIPDDIKYYAELFKIGILMLVMEDKSYTDFIESKDPSLISNINDVEVIEICAAPYNQVQPKYQALFCKEALGISTIKEVFTWGKRA